MADNIKIDLLINAAQSAKTIQETKKALRDLKSEAMNLTEGTAAFTKVATAAGQLQDKIGDLSATTKYLGDDLRNIKAISGIGQGIAAGFAIASGAAALFGGENKKLQESMVKLQAIMAVMQGMEQIGAVLQKESAAMLGIKNAVTKTAIFLTSEQAVAEAAEAVAAGTATVAQRALNAAMNANPIGILITLILAGVAALTLWGGKTKELTEEQKALNKTLLDMRTNSEVELKTFNSQIEALKALKTGSEERAIAIKKINDQYGTTLKNLSDENKFLIQVKAAQDSYIEGSKRRLLVKINESKVEALLREAQDKTEKSRYAASKAQAILDNSDTLRKIVKGKTDYEIALSQFVTSEGLELQRLTALKINSKQEADIANAKAEKLLDINAQMLSKETANEKAERLKQEAATKKADDDKIDADKKAAADNIKASKVTAAQLLKDKQEAWKKEEELKKAHQDILDNLERYIYETNNEYLTLTYEAYVSAYDKELALLELSKEEKINAQNELLAAQLKAIEDGIKKDLEALGLYGAAYDKEYKIRLTKATAAGTIYASAVNSTNQLVVAITETSEKERTRIVEDENKKRLELQRQAAEIILSKDTYSEFQRFGKAVTTQYISTTELAIKKTGSFIDFIKNIFKKNEPFFFIKSLDMSRMEKFSDDLDLYNKRIDPTISNIVKSYLTLKDGIETSLGQSDEGNNMLLRIYTDKIRIIKEQEEKINAERQKAATPEKPAVPFSVAGAGASGIEGLSSEETASLEVELTKRYNTIIASRKSIFDSEIKGLYTDYKKDYDSIESSTEPTRKKNKKKEELNTEYFKKIEKLTENNEDALLVIGRAYGKVSDEELNAHHKRKLAKKKAQSDEEKAIQQKIKEAELQLEIAAQAALLSIFNNQMDIRSKANQKAYEEKIALIDAEESAYKNAQANRTTLQQAQYDTEQGFAEQRKNAERVRQLEEDKIKKKQFNAQKINDAATVAIRTSIAVMTALAILPPAGPILAALYGATGVIEEAAILSKKYIPTYATGGLVMGPGTGTSDSINARLSNGESVINAKSTSMFAPMLSAINQAGGGVAIPHTKNVIFNPNSSTSGGLDTDGIINAINELNNRPIETYVKEVSVTNSQNRADKLKRRTSF